MNHKICWILFLIFVSGCNTHPKKVTEIKNQTSIFKTMVLFDRPSLQRDNLLAKIDNQAVAIQSFQSSETPISLFLVLDVSGGEDISELQRALIGLIKRLPAESEVSVLFSNLGHESTNAFSKNQSSLAELIDSYKSVGRSTFFVSILPLVRSTSRFLQRSNQRVAAVYVTSKDSFFENDEITKETEVILQRIKEENAAVPVIGIYIGKENDDEAKRSAVIRILEATGGTCFFATKPEELQKIMDQINNTLSGLYTVGLDVDSYLNDGNTHPIAINSKEGADKGKLAGNIYSPKKLTQPTQSPIPQSSKTME
jgi:hypothetical protein